MRLGLFLFSSASDSVWRAVRAEAEGFDSVWAPEFVTRRPDGREHGSPISTLSYIAAVTRRVRLGTAVIGALKHHPAVLSQEAATLHQLSGGRLVLGLGPGARRQNLVLGVDRRWDEDFMVEYIELMRAMWRWEPVSFKGRYFEFEAAPASRPAGDTVPVLVGGFSEPARRAAGRAGDGWMANWIFSPELFKKLMEDVRSAARESGRDPSMLEGVYLAGVAVAESEEEQLAFARRLAFGVMPKIQLQDYGYKVLELSGFKPPVEEPDQVPEKLVRETFLLGSPDDAIKRIEDYEKAGVTELALYFASDESERLFATRVLPYFRERRG